MLGTDEISNPGSSAGGSRDFEKEDSRRNLASELGHCLVYIKGWLSSFSLALPGKLLEIGQCCN